MLFLQKIIITHFKNYEISSFDFSSRVVGICGRNGIGKTNLLDAIHYCSFTKSYFSGTDLVNTGTNKEGFRLQAEFKQNDFTQQVVCIYKINGKKVASKEERFQTWNLKPQKPTFLGVVIDSLFSFFMLFVIMAGLASVILFFISSERKK